MKKLKYNIGPLLLVASHSLLEQTLYVDAVRGKEGAKGTMSEPQSNLEKAVIIANSYIGNEPVNIWLAPAFYVIAHELAIKTSNSKINAPEFTVEATIMPDDKDGQPEKNVCYSISLAQ